MTVSAGTNTWKQRLAAGLAQQAELAREIDVYEQQITLRKQFKLDEKLFAETRLRRGAYGQRYDNGQRHDGVASRTLAFNPALTKGPETLWDAPGMMRIKIPYGGINPGQLEVMADLAEDYSDGIIHVTTRQDFQLHYIHIDDTPDLMRRLAAVGITTREACGNSVRNVTACPIAGVCREEAFDVTPYAKELTYFLLGHPDTQDFGRKFKIAFSGCAQNPCGLTNLHDMGFIARTRADERGNTERGFEVYVGGGLGAVPHEAKLLYAFMPERDLFPMAQAVSRVFARLGEKKNRNRARIKFLVAKLGVDEFRRLVEEERKVMPPDPRWEQWLQRVPAWHESPLRNAVQLNGRARPEGFDGWCETNVYHQRQPGYATVTLALPLGDIASWQARALADIARAYCGEHLRTTVEQNIVLRWVSERDLIDLYTRLREVGLAQPGAGTIVDITACPGTDTCKLGIASSRGLAGELRTRLAAKSAQLDEAVKGLRIKVSGCFNSCGQHHVADLGFYGNSKKVGNHTVPHFQVVLGGKWRDNAGSYGLAVGAVPSKRIPQVVDMITDWYVQQRTPGETFQAFIARVGKRAVRDRLEPLMEVPPHTQDPSLYVDWADAREFTIGDMGVGECAGEVVTLTQFQFAEAEREEFEAQLALEAREFARADRLAYHAMLKAARALVRKQWLDCPEEPAVVVAEFRKRFFDTELFFDRFAKGKFANFLFDRHEREARPGRPADADSARQAIEEARLFIEAAHACDQRMPAAV